MNPFSALESDDEDEFIKVQSHKKSGDSKKPTQAKNNSTAAPAVAPAVTVSNADKKNSGRGGGGRGDNRSKGRGAGRGGKETGERKHGKREYDRRSGTGRGTEVAKGGAGKGGWGTNEDEIAHQRRELETGETPIVDKEKVEVEEEPVVPEVPTYTLDEFLARREAERSNSTIFKKVEERAVTDDFSNFKKGGDELENFVVLGSGKAKSSNAKSQRATNQTKVTDLGFHAAPKEEFREDRGDRGGRGGRGGKGGKGGRGGDRGERRSAPRTGGKVVDINDQSAFPSL